MRLTVHSRNWQAFYDGVRNNDVFDERTTIMLYLASAMAVGCDP